MSRNGRQILAVAVVLASLLFPTGCATNPRAKGELPSSRAAQRSTCLDTLHTADTISAVVKLTVTPQDQEATLPLDFDNLLAEELRSQLKVPPRMALSVVMGSPPCDSLGSRCIGGILSMGAVAYATAHKDGRLSDIEVVDVALIPGFADSVSSALRSMSRGALAPFVGDADSIPFIMQISSEENPDTVPTFRYLFKARVPRYDVPFSYASMPMAGVDAEYPFTARIAGVGDSVTVAFTVDRDGTVVPQSIELVRASYRDFVSSVFKALAHTRYHPAHLGDCAVATRMKQRFLFKAPE